MAKVHKDTDVDLKLVILDVSGVQEKLATGRGFFPPHSLASERHPRMKGRK